jgi:hypothetical protein
MRAFCFVALLAAPAFADEPQQVRGETIIIREHGPGYKLPEPKKDPMIAPKYSDAAIERDAWTRAWMVLDIDERGVVRRMKFLNRPGYDLEQIAIDRAFATHFEPAHDGRGRAQSAMLVYPIEWPSYWWLITHTGLATRIPSFVGGVPCRGTGPLNLDRAHPVYRDCTGPDLTKLTVEPWIERPRKKP